MSKVSENIRKFRNERNLTQSDLGKLLGKAPSVIANWEAETNRPDVDSIIKMLEIFKIDANMLFGWDIKQTKGHINTLLLTEQTHLQKYRRLNEMNKRAIDITIDTMLIAQNDDKKGAQDAKNDEKTMAGAG